MAMASDQGAALPPAAATAPAAAPSTATTPTTAAAAPAAAPSTDPPCPPVAALSQPTRARIFARLSAAPEPLATEALAAQLGLHPNGVRLHLERLLAAGLVQRRRQHLARGRPRDLWSVSAGAQPSSGAPTGYGALSRWLVRLLRTAGVDAPTIAVTGQEIGRELAAGTRLRAGDTEDDSPETTDSAETTESPDSPETTDSPVIAGSSEQPASPERRLFVALGSLGFQPRRERMDSTGITYSLRNCPYERAVSTGELLVCELHRSITGGLVTALDPHCELVSFTARDPRAADCTFCVRGLR